MRHRSRVPPVFLRAEWRHLAMLNYEVEPELLRPRVPPGTQLDTWDGKHFVSLVGFLFLKTRVLGVPIPGHGDFEEVNLRMYVGRQGPEGWRRGVTFIREIVPHGLITTWARILYNEPYLTCPMDRSLCLTPAEDGVISAEYRWGFGGLSYRLGVSASGEPRALQPGSLEEFVAEHYWGYTAQRHGGSAEYRVEHPPWSAWPADEFILEGDAAALYGEEFAEVLSRPPHSAFLADGSPVLLRWGERIA